MATNLNTRFMDAANDLRRSPDQKMDATRTIIDHPDFAGFAQADPDGATYVIEDVFQTLQDPEDVWQVAMAFIQTEGAQALADSANPEILLRPVQEAAKKMQPEDKEIFETFFWQTKAGQKLEGNYPAARLKMAEATGPADDPTAMLKALLSLSR